LKGVSNQGVIDAYRWVIEAVADARLRLYLYHIPQLSGVSISHKVVATLMELYPQTIVGIKDSRCQLQVSLDFADAFMDRVMVYVGNEPDLQTLAARGSTGAISGVANIMPRLVQRLVGAYAAPAAAEDQRRVLAMLEILGGYGLTAAFKGVMAVRTGRRGWLRVRPPLVPLSGTEYERLDAQIRAFGIDPNAD
jgi:4-hydroxy-tetrahydrodipicolinate synthase